jgi:osmotically-inducible protein OsmY
MKFRDKWVATMRTITILMVFAFLTAACQSAYADKRTDDALYDLVKQRLASDRDAKGGGIQVDVLDGVVTLSGKVPEAKEKTAAERVTRKTKGVKAVVNKLEVETLPPRNQR